MILLAQAEVAGISKLSEFGPLGVILALALGALVYAVRNDRSNLVDWRVEARADLKEERLARQAHEVQMTKLLGELIAQVTEQREAAERTAEAMVRILEELKRIKSAT